MSDLQEPNWKEIALELAKRVSFALNYLKASGTGMIANFNGDQPVKLRHWHDYFADGIELVPGASVDRELLQTKRLPANKQRKARAEIEARRAAEGKNEEQK